MLSLHTVLARAYHSRRMRTHQSTIARLDNVFQPIQSLFEDNDETSGSAGRYARKRAEEQLTRTPSFITKYIEAFGLGSPRTASAFRSLVGRKRPAVRFLDQLRPKSRFIAAAMQEAELPLATLPEIAVVGRSNAGKSTLINAIVGSRCCDVRNKPGSTQQLAFYRIGDPPLLTLVDLPGFGFAYADAATRSQWAEFSLWYLRARRSLRCVLLVVDARHGLADSDLEMISFMRSHKHEFRIVVNKTDLVEAGTLGKRLAVIGKDLNVPDSQLLDRVLPVSALRHQGLERLRSVCEQFKLKRQVTVAGGATRAVADLLEARRLRKAQQRTDRAERQEKLKSEIFGLESVPERKLRRRKLAPDASNCYEAEPDAYNPDELSIVKRVSGEPIGDVRMLDFENFVSEDEINNLGLKGGRHKTDVPAPVPGEENTHYEAQMKLNHELGWKMKLDLEVTPTWSSVVEPSDSKTAEEVSALGYISTYNPESVPKGIQKWKVAGLKPTIKTSRRKAPLDTAASLKKDAMKLSAETRDKQPRRWRNSFTNRNSSP